MTSRIRWTLYAVLASLAAVVAALIWFSVLRSPRPSPRVRQQQQALTAAINPTEAVQQQIAALGQSLQILSRAWQNDPGHFSVQIGAEALFASGVAPHLLLLNRDGKVLQSTVPDQLGADLHDRAIFLLARARAARQDNNPVHVIRIDPMRHQWRISVARWLHGADGSFAGVMVADAPIYVIQRLLGPQTPTLPPGAVPTEGQPSRIALYAAVVSGLMLVLAGFVFVRAETVRRQRNSFETERILLASANVQLESARARADAKAAQLEATLAGMSDGVALMDGGLRLVQWNQRFAELVGVPPHLLQAGTSMEDILRAQAEGGQFGQVQVEAEVARRLAALQGLQTSATLERRRPDGRIIELRRNPLPGGGFVTLYRDVTERRRSDDAMREARALAEAATAAKSRFVTIVSHEIRSPLGALLNTLRLLGDDGLAPAQQALLHIARQSGEALYGLVNDILDMSSMEAGQLTLRPSVFVLEPLLDGVVQMFQTQAAERGITLHLAADPALPAEICADPGRLRQVLINLLSNAVKFGVPGPVMLLARRDHHDEPQSPMLLLVVRDRGPVIEAAGRARLFRPFSRLDLAGGEPLGSGLGLAICRYLVTLMGGEIGCDPWVAEDGRVGNAFWVRLPLAPLPAGRQPRSTAAETSERLLLPRTRVLLVEDVTANQLVTALLLRREGHLVDVADTGEAALRAVAHIPYDLVFTDIHLPGMSGAELARQIRTLSGAAGAVPIIALSANTGPDDRLALDRVGIVDLLDKPVALSDLVAALHRCVWRGRPGHTATPQSAAPFPVAPVLAAERINELRAHLPADALRDMVQECLVDLQARLPALRRALQTGDPALAANHAHAMVGMAAGYGMAALEQRLRALMTAVRGPHTDAAAAALEQLETDLAQSAQALREALRVELV